MTSYRYMVVRYQFLPREQTYVEVGKDAYPTLGQARRAANAAFDTDRVSPDIIDTTTGEQVG